jgi:hypothetical protein
LKVECHTLLIVMEGVRQGLLNEAANPEFDSSIPVCAAL